MAEDTEAGEPLLIDAALPHRPGPAGAARSRRAPG